MDIQKDDVAGGVLSKIIGNSSCIGAVLEIEQALGVDGEFPAALNLVEKLQSIIEPLYGDSANATSWSDALRAVQDADPSRKKGLSWTRLAPTSRAGNPLGGRFKRYPIAAFFLQEPMAGLAGQVNIIHRLFLAALLQRQSAHGLHAIADDLRKLIARGGAQSSIYRLPQTTEAGWEVLASTLANLPESDLLAARLRTLLKMVTMTKAGQPALTRPTSALTEPQTTRTTFRPAQGGVVPEHRIQVAEPGNSEIAEPPRYVDFHVAEPDAGEEGEPASETEVDANSRETRHWISRHQRITPNDVGRLTAIERRWLGTTLCDLIQSEDSSLRMGAGLVALVYVTGMQFETLLDAEIGPAGVFDTCGVYRRTIRAPTNAYTPDKEMLDQFLPRETMLSLQLPVMLVPWLDTLIRQSTGTVLESLGVDVASANVNVDSVMHLLRAKGRYTRIRRERIPAALAIELNLRYRDVGLVHHLASSAEQVAPMINYYVSHFIGDLQRRYREVADAMLPAQ